MQCLALSITLLVMLIYIWIPRLIALIPPWDYYFSHNSIPHNIMINRVMYPNCYSFLYTRVEQHVVELINTERTFFSVSISLVVHHKLLSELFFYCGHTHCFEKWNWSSVEVDRVKETVESICVCSCISSYTESIS